MPQISPKLKDVLQNLIGAALWLFSVWLVYCLIAGSLDSELSPNWGTPSLCLAALLLLALLAGESQAPLLRRWFEGAHRALGLVLARPRLSAWIMAAAWFGFFSAYVILRHEAFASSIDLANHGNAIWHTVQGRPLFSSIYGYSLFGEHMHPAFMLLAIPYALLPYAHTLLILQVAALASAGPAIYLFTRRLGGQPALGLALAVLYFVHPGLIGLTVYDIHPIAYATSLWIWFFVFWPQRSWQAAGLAGTALLFGEESWAFCAGLGLYMALCRRKPLWGLGLVLLSLGGFAFTTRVFAPYFNPEAQYLIHQRYAQVGGSIGGILSTALNNPGLILGVMFTGDKLVYLFKVLKYVCFLPALAPGGLLLAVPVLAGVLLSGYAPQWHFTHEYSAMILPGLFFAAALGIRRALGIHFIRANAVMIALALALTGVATAGQSLMPHMLAWAGQDNVHVERILKKVPDQGRVTTQACLAAHLLNRKGLGVLGYAGIEDGSLLICLDKDPWPYTREELKELMDKLIKERGFKLTAREKTCVLLRNK